MTISASNKIRAISGASAIALSAGFAGATSAQAAPPAPVPGVPTPTPPTAPGNIEECALITTVPEVVCAPGTDPDGFQEPFNSIDATVEAGSQVQGEINLLVGANVLVDGDIISTTGRVIDVGAASTVVNNGFLSNTTSPFSGMIRTGDGSFITNNGIITSTQSNMGGVEFNSNSTFINNGEISLSGFGTIGVSGTGSVSAFGSETGSTVINSITGSIIVGPGVAGIFLGDEATVDNHGLIQTFGTFTIGVVVGDDSAVTNNGIIFTIGDAADGVDAGDNATIINTGAGDIFTFGDGAIGVDAGDNSTLQNNGIILTRGDDANAVDLGDGSTFTNNPTGQLSTTGQNSDVVRIDGAGTVVNIGGLLQATGDDATGVFIDGDGTLDNSGTITSALGDAVFIGGVGTVTNRAGGVISSKGADGVEFDSDGGMLINDGLIESDDDEAVEASSVSDLTVINRGTIRTTANGDKAIESEENLTIVNYGLITSAVDEAIEAEDAGLNLTNMASGQIIARFDDAVDGDDNVFINNMGLIQGGENDGLELNSGTIINSGTIESIDSDPNGSLIIGGVVPELDAAIDFDAGTPGNEDGVVQNLVGGLIIGDIGVNASSGNQDNPAANLGSQVVYNFGTITGRGVNAATGGRVDAVLLSEGDDVFIKLNDGVENGAVDGEGGTDVFAYILSDTTDRTFDLSLIGTQYFGFEDLRFGSQTFDFVNLTATGAPTATGVLTLTGTSNDAITIVNTAILDGTVNATVTHVAGAGDGIAQGLSITGNGAISTTGDGEIGFNAGDDVFLTTDGSITTTGMNTAAVLMGANAAITNGGAILSDGMSSVAIAAGDGSNLTNLAGATITTTGDNGFNTVITGDGTIDNAGIISASGAGAQAVTITGDGTVTNSGIIAAADGRALDIGGVGTVTNAAGGTIAAGGADAIRFNTSGSTLINDGTIATSGDNTAAVLADTMSTITNNGAVDTTGTGGVGLVARDGSTVTNSATGTVSTTGDDAGGVIVVGAGTLTNAGMIATTGTNATGVLFTGAATIDNSGTVSADAARAFDLAAASTVNNSGTIMAGTDGIRFNAGSTLTNTATGSITADIGVTGSADDDTIVNFGAINGTTAGVALGDGSDEFQQWTGATVMAGIDLGGGGDLLILEGSSSSVGALIDGGAGTDTAILAGVLDSDNLANFETLQLGSTLGGTLNDLTITGARTVTGDVVHVGEVFVNLGVDSLTTDGSITLESTGVLTIATPLDEALVGQTVLVFQDGTGFTDNGATINILDDDLLIDYTPVVGSLFVEVSAVNPLVGNGDANLDTFGNVVANAITAGTLNATTLATLNSLSETQFLTAAQDALPSLSESLGREVFETAEIASQALDRHLAGESSGIWGQFVVRGAQQDALSLSADGYDSDQLIVTVGGDFAVAEGTRIGFLASYADIDSQDLRNDVQPTETTQAESIKLGVYVASKLLDRGFLNSELAYITGEAETARSGFFGPIASEFDFDGFSARATLGYDLLADENVSLTPSIGAHAMRINFDDAQESGGFGFLVERGDAAFAELRGAIELGAQISEGVSGFISGTVIRDLVGDEDPRSFRLSSTQLPTFFADLPLREQNRFELAAGATVDVSDTFSIDVGYLGDFNEGYSGHAARATVRIGF